MAEREYAADGGDGKRFSSFQLPLSRESASRQQQTAVYQQLLSVGMI